MRILSGLIILASRVSAFNLCALPTLRSTTLSSAKGGLFSKSAQHSGSFRTSSLTVRAGASTDRPYHLGSLNRRLFSVGGAVLLASGVSSSPAAGMEPSQPAALKMERDPEFPGTSMPRLYAITERVMSLTQTELDGPWPDVRRRLLWAGGLRDIPSTGHAFNDYNHCDLTPMGDQVQDESNKDGAVAGISRTNALGSHIRTASLPELGPGGSWSTCILGAGQNPPSDVAHVQFNSRIAFKLVWAPPLYSTFVLVDDAGLLLAKGTPQEGSGLPSLQERKANFNVVRGGRYAVVAEKTAQ